MEPDSRPSGSPSFQPRLGPSRPSTLFVAGLAAAAVSWLLISRFYYDIEPLPWLPVVTVAALAVLEAYIAINTRARIERRSGHEPVDPLAVARFAVLAKASALAGSVFVGFYIGVLTWVLIEPTETASNGVPAAAAGAVAALGLVAAALWLEHSCRVPKGPDDEDESTTRGK